ncbi:MAG: DUF86 domain-containing protein [Chloroflexota bacterium]
MTEQREYLDYVEDVLDAIEKVAQFTEGMGFEQFVEDEKTAFAVIRALEIIGEAVRKIPLSVRNRYAAIPWREMAGMRDKLIHDYFGVNLAVVWKTVTTDLPALEPEMRRILAEAQR